MAEVKLFEVNLNETINNIKRLEEELKAIKKALKTNCISLCKKILFIFLKDKLRERRTEKDYET